jgi:hypothetical protein
MKLIGLMSLREQKEEIKKLFEKHQVQLFSEVEITGHTFATLKQYGWISSQHDIAIYSTLCFAIISKEKADEIMKELLNISEKTPSEHPIRAFQVNVEKMI